MPDSGETYNMGMPQQRPRVSGMLPVKFNVPLRGSVHRFMKLLVMNEAPKLSFDYKKLGKPLPWKIIIPIVIIVLLIVIIYLAARALRSRPQKQRPAPLAPPLTPPPNLGPSQGPASEPTPGPTGPPGGNQL